MSNYLMTCKKFANRDKNFHDKFILTNGQLKIVKRKKYFQKLV